MIEKLGRDLLFNLALLLALVVVYLTTLLVAAHGPTLADKVQDFALGTVTGGILTAIQRGRADTGESKDKTDM